MKKVLKHLKNNAAIYLILLACLVVIIIALFVNSPKELKPVDTSMFDVVSLDKAIRLFDDNDAKILVISTDTCQATAAYADALKYSMTTYNYKVYFLSLTKYKPEENEEKYNKLGELFNTNYQYQKQNLPLIEFVKHGYTPTTIIIKNKKIVYAFIGKMNTSTLDSLATAYGLGETDD